MRTLTFALCALVLVSAKSEDGEAGAPETTATKPATDADVEMVGDKEAIEDFKKNNPDYLEKAAPLIDEARKSGGSVRYMDCRHVLGGCECYHPDYFPLSRNTGNAIEHGEFNCRTACLACRPANDRCIEESAGKFVQQLKDPEHECGLENPAMCEIHRCNMFAIGHLLVSQDYFAKSPLLPVVEKAMENKDFLDFTDVNKTVMLLEIIKNAAETKIVKLEMKSNIGWGADQNMGIPKALTTHLIQKTKPLQDKHSRVVDYNEYFEKNPLGAFVFFHINSEACGKVSNAFKHAEHHLFRARSPGSTGTGHVNCAIYPDLCKSVGLECGVNCPEKFPQIYFMQSPDANIGGEVRIFGDEMESMKYQQKILDWYNGINETLTTMLIHNPAMQKLTGITVRKNGDHKKDEKASDDSEFEL